MGASETTENAILEVRRTDLARARIQGAHPEPLQPGQLRLRIERFALTANNITYGVMGEILGYWEFFPSPEAEAGWGRIPAMGWGEVIDSGDRPLSLLEDRDRLRPACSQAWVSGADRRHLPGEQAVRREPRPLLTGVELRQGEGDTAGGLRCHRYGGNGEVLDRVHAHLADRLEHSMIVGMSHHDAERGQPSAGPDPEMFFAPSEVKKRTEELGRERYQRQLAEALAEFIEGSNDWLEVEWSSGPDEALAAYRELLEGAVPPSRGRIVSLW